MNANITILDLESYSGLTLERLGELALERIAKARTPDISDRWLRKTFRLAADQPLEEALRQRAADNIARYRAVLPEKTRTFGEQARACERLALDRRYLNAVWDFSLVITDDLLHRGLPGDLRGWVPPYNVCAFSIERNTVYVASTLPNRIVAHEVGHALSLRLKQQQIGFLRLQPRPNGCWQRLGSKWFDEGTTVFWEELAVNDGSTLPERQDPRNTYCWYRDATRELLEVLGVGHETALRAYFGNDTARRAVEARVIARFGCLIDDLQHVGLCQKMSFTRPLLRGQPVEHQLPGARVRVRRSGKLVTEPPDPKLIDDWRKLARIFPNLTLIECKR